MMRIVKMITGGSPPLDGSHYVADCRSFDIPETVVAIIRNAAPGLVAITLSPFGGMDMVAAAERAARKRGVRILWFKRWPHDL